MADNLDKNSVSLRKERDSFLDDLKRFHNNRGTPFRHFPSLSGREVDLFLLYNKVTALGGWEKVNEHQRWEEIQVDFHLPKGCSNAAQALRDTYIRYLDVYEKIHHFGEDPDRKVAESEDQALPGQRRKKINYASIVPSQYNHPQHYLSVSLRETIGLCKFVEPGMADKVTKSLMSGLPNEMDFAVNICTLLSSEGKHTLQLDKCPQLLTLLLAHIGICETGPASLKPLHLDGWKPAQNRNYFRFWWESVEDRETRKLISPDSALEDEEEAGPSISDVLCLERDLGLNDKEGQRVLQICMIIRNLSFEPENMKILASNNLVLRFIMLCMKCKYHSIRQLALDTLGNITVQMSLKPRDPSIAPFILSTVANCIQSPDKFEIVTGLDMLSRLCQVEESSNEEIICERLAVETYEKIVSYLTVHDIQLIVYTLECLYQLTELGEIPTTHIAKVTRSVSSLVALVTIEAQSYGPDSIKGIKVVEHIPAGMTGVTSGGHPHHPVASTSAEVGKVVTPHKVVGGHRPQAVPTPPPGLAKRPSVTATPPPLRPTPAPATAAPKEVDSQHLCAWLQSNYEVAEGYTVSQLEVYTSYLKAFYANIKKAPDYRSMNMAFRVSFPRVELKKIQADGKTDTICCGIKKRDPPQPFPPDGMIRTPPPPLHHMVRHHHPLPMAPPQPWHHHNAASPPTTPHQPKYSSSYNAQPQRLTFHSFQPGMLPSQPPNLQGVSPYPMPPPRPPTPQSPQTNASMLQQALMNKLGTNTPIPSPGQPPPQQQTLIKSLLASKVQQSMNQQPQSGFAVPQNQASYTPTKQMPVAPLNQNLTPVMGGAVHVNYPASQQKVPFSSYAAQQVVQSTQLSNKGAGVSNNMSLKGIPQPNVQLAQPMNNQQQQFTTNQNVPNIGNNQENAINMQQQWPQQQNQATVPQQQLQQNGPQQGNWANTQQLQSQNRANGFSQQANPSIGVETDVNPPDVGVPQLTHSQQSPRPNPTSNFQNQFLHFSQQITTQPASVPISSQQSPASKKPKVKKNKVNSGSKSPKLNKSKSNPDESSMDSTSTSASMESFNVPSENVIINTVQHMETDLTVCNKSQDQVAPGNVLLETHKENQLPSLTSGVQLEQLKDNVGGAKESTIERISNLPESDSLEVSIAKPVIAENCNVLPNSGSTVTSCDKMEISNLETGANVVSSSIGQGSNMGQESSYAPQVSNNASFTYKQANCDSNKTVTNFDTSNGNYTVPRTNGPGNASLTINCHSMENAPSLPNGSVNYSPCSTTGTEMPFSPTSVEEKKARIAQLMKDTKRIKEQMLGMNGVANHFDSVVKQQQPSQLSLPSGIATQSPSLSPVESQGLNIDCNNSADTIALVNGFPEQQQTQQQQQQHPVNGNHTDMNNSNNKTINAHHSDLSPAMSTDSSIRRRTESTDSRDSVLLLEEDLNTNNNCNEGGDDSGNDSFSLPPSPAPPPSNTQSVDINNQVPPGSSVQVYASSSLSSSSVSASINNAQVTSSSGTVVESMDTLESSTNIPLTTQLSSKKSLSQQQTAMYNQQQLSDTAVNATSIIQTTQMPDEASSIPSRPASNVSVDMAAQQSTAMVNMLNQAAGNNQMSGQHSGMVQAVMQQPGNPMHQVVMQVHGNNQTQVLSGQQVSSQSVHNQQALQQSPFTAHNSSLQSGQQNQMIVQGQTQGQMQIPIQNQAVVQQTQVVVQGHPQIGQQSNLMIPVSQQQQIQAMTHQTQQVEQQGQLVVQGMTLQGQMVTQGQQPMSQGQIVMQGQGMTQHGQILGQAQMNQAQVVVQGQQVTQHSPVAMQQVVQSQQGQGQPVILQNQHMGQSQMNLQGQQQLPQQSQQVLQHGQMVVQAQQTTQGQQQILQQGQTTVQGQQMTPQGQVLVQGQQIIQAGQIVQGQQQLMHQTQQGQPVVQQQGQQQMMHQAVVSQGQIYLQQGQTVFQQGQQNMSQGQQIVQGQVTTQPMQMVQSNQGQVIYHHGATTTQSVVHSQQAQPGIQQGQVMVAPHNMVQGQMIVQSQGPQGQPIQVQVQQMVQSQGQPKLSPSLPTAQSLVQGQQIVHQTPTINQGQQQQIVTGQQQVMQSQPQQQIVQGQTYIQGQPQVIQTQQQIVQGQVMQNASTGVQQLVQGQGQFVQSPGQFVTSSGQLVQSQGQLVQSQGQFIQSQGQLVQSQQLIKGQPQQMFQSQPLIQGQQMANNPQTGQIVQANQVVQRPQLVASQLSPQLVPSQIPGQQMVRVQQVVQGQQGPQIIQTVVQAANSQTVMQGQGQMVMMPVQANQGQKVYVQGQGSNVQISQGQPIMSTGQAQNRPLLQQPMNQMQPQQQQTLVKTSNNTPGQQFVIQTNAQQLPQQMPSPQQGPMMVQVQLPSPVPTPPPASPQSVCSSLPSPAPATNSRKKKRTAAKDAQGENAGERPKRKRKSRSKSTDSSKSGQMSPAVAGQQQATGFTGVLAGVAAQPVTPQPPPPLQYMCEWSACKRLFDAMKTLRTHVQKTHFDFRSNRGLCHWEGCDKLIRQKWSLITHIQEKHLSDPYLQAAALRRQQNPQSPAPTQMASHLQHRSPAASPAPQLPTLSASSQAPTAVPTAGVYPQDAAIQAIKRFCPKPPYPEFMELKEGPVTKHIRLTAALILRNMARYSTIGRSEIKKHENHLAYVALSPVESSAAISNCLFELHKH